MAEKKTSALISNLLYEAYLALKESLSGLPSDSPIYEKTKKSIDSIETQIFEHYSFLKKNDRLVVKRDYEPKEKL